MTTAVAYAAGSLLLTPALAWAWGNQGHDIVAVAAHDRLSAKARDKVDEILDGIPLAEASVFADRVRRQRPETTRWHFVDIPIEVDDYDAARDCKKSNEGDCVIEAIGRCVSALRNGGDGCGRNEREHLMFLIHFVGDIHQPLHCATKTDPQDDGGGNGTRVCFFNVCTSGPNRKPKSLHGVWDTDLIIATEPDDAKFVEQLQAVSASRSPAKRAQIAAGTPLDWANESHRLAVDQAYRNLPDHPIHGRFRLGSFYFGKEAPIVKLQLERAVLRLARVLEELYGSP